MTLRRVFYQFQRSINSFEVQCEERCGAKDGAVRRTVQCEERCGAKDVAVRGRYSAKDGAVPRTMQCEGRLYCECALTAVALLTRTKLTVSSLAATPAQTFNLIKANDDRVFPIFFSLKRQLNFNQAPNRVNIYLMARERR